MRTGRSADRLVTLDALRLAPLSTCWTCGRAPGGQAAAVRGSRLGTAAVMLPYH